MQKQRRRRRALEVGAEVEAGAEEQAGAEAGVGAGAGAGVGGKVEWISLARLG